MKPSTDMVKVVDGPSCNCRRLAWWAEEDHEWHADQCNLLSKHTHHDSRLMKIAGSQC